MKIENEEKKLKEDYLHTALQFYKEDLKAAKENDKKSSMLVKEQLIQGLKIQNLRKKPILEDLFIDEEDILDTKYMKDKKLILGLIEKTNFSKGGNIYYEDNSDEDMKAAKYKTEKNKIKLDDFLHPKPQILENQTNKKTERKLTTGNIKTENTEHQHDRLKQCTKIIKKVRTMNLLKLCLRIHETC